MSPRAVDDDRCAFNTDHVPRSRWDRLSQAATSAGLRTSDTARDVPPIDDRFPGRWPSAVERLRFRYRCGAALDSHQIPSWLPPTISAGEPTPLKSSNGLKSDIWRMRFHELHHPITARPTAGRTTSILSWSGEVCRAISYATSVSTPTRPCTPAPPADAFSPGRASRPVSQPSPHFSPPTRRRLPRRVVAATCSRSASRRAIPYPTA